MRTIVSSIVLIVVAGLALGACATREEINSALREVDRLWKIENDKIREEMGRAVVDATPDQAFNALENTLEALGFTISEKDRDSGNIFGVAPAPTPLSLQEWEEGRKTDEPQVKSIVAKSMPITSLFMAMHHDEVEVHISGAVRSANRATEVSVAYTVLDKKAIRMGVHSMDNPGPTLARIGMIKAWKEFERQLARVQGKGG